MSKNSHSEISALQLAYVEWDDSAAQQGWREFDDARNMTPGRMQSIGWIIADEPTHIVLTAHAHRDHPDNGSVPYVSDPMCIPRVAITHMTVFDRPRPEE